MRSSINLDKEYGLYLCGRVDVGISCSDRVINEQDFEMFCPREGVLLQDKILSQRVRSELFINPQLKAG
jgi:hypothetical protein